MDKLFKTRKRIFCYLGLVIMFVLMGNSNNVPEIFAERIFKPIRGNEWTIHYAGLIVILGIYYFLKQLNKISEKSLNNKKNTAFIVTIVLIIVLPGIWIYCIQFYKGFSKNLNSIYLDREETLVNFYGNEEEVTVRGAIDIINCSNDIQEFKIKIKTSSFIKEDIKEEYFTLENEVKLYPKEEKTLTINEVIKANREYKNSVYASEAFEYIFFNDEGEVVFKGTLDFY